MGNAASITENERKYLVIGDGWKQHVVDDTHIIQGYIPPSQTKVSVVQNASGCFLKLTQDASWIEGKIKKPEPMTIPLDAQTATHLLEVFRSVKKIKKRNPRIKGEDTIPLLLSEDDTLRIRLDKYGAKIAMKTPRTYQHDTIVRKEIEVPISDSHKAESLLAFFCDRVIEKHRFYVPYGDQKHRWEIDVFTDDPIKGLVTAEIELSNPNMQIQLPDWIGEDVTKESKYSSRALASTHEEEKVTVKVGAWQKKILDAVHAQHAKNAPDHQERVRF